MPFVQIDWLEGRDDKTKEKLFLGITKAFEEIGVKKESINIIIRDNKKSDWAIGDKPFSNNLLKKG